jgi:putative acetyltransferase
MRIAIEDPRAADVHELLDAHLAFARASSPPCAVHALAVEGLAEPGVSFFACRREGELLCVAALRELDPVRAEIKSMHTALRARASGVGRAMVAHLLEVAREPGYERVSLETGSQDAFARPKPCMHRRASRPARHSAPTARANTASS